MLPTSANSFSRSMKISTSCPSSKIATLRSCEVADITNSFDMKTPWDMHRRWNLTVGGPRQGAAPTQVGARSPHIYCGDIAFVAGGSDRLAVLVFLEPLAIEAGPLPGFSRGNGGRCYPHS